jgi:hypothetical protein
MHLYSRTTSWGRMKEKFPASLKSDEAMQWDEIIERVEPELSSSEIFAVCLSWSWRAK